MIIYLLYILSNMCQPYNSAGFYGQSILIEVGVVTLMPAAPLGSPPCTGTRSRLPVVDVQRRKIRLN
jgi:hypothetical protein